MSTSDARGGDAREFTVDGETFHVTAEPRNQYRFDWVSGPNPGYGFVTAIYGGGTLDDQQVVASIHDFLAEIDPETGCLAD